MNQDEAPRAPLPARRARVLCVDDESNLLEGLRRHVGRVHDLVLVQSAEEALRHIQGPDPFDAVVSDMRMPGMDGATFLARVIDRRLLEHPNAHVWIDGLGRMAGGLHPRLVAILDRLQPSVSGRVLRSVMLRDLGPGMVLDQDVRTKTGQLVVPRGQEVTHSVIQRLSNFEKSVGIEEPIRVGVLAGATA